MQSINESLIENARSLLIIECNIMVDEKSFHAFFSRLKVNFNHDIELNFGKLKKNHYLLLLPFGPSFNI